MRMQPPPTCPRRRRRVTNPYRKYSDSGLLQTLASAVRGQRAATVKVVAIIAEVDRRKLFLRPGFSSMFEYCVRKLGLSEQSAYLRITAARKSRRYPVILEMLADGRLHLAHIGRLSKWLRPENSDELLHAASGKTRAELLQLLAERFPQQDARTVVREVAGGVATPVSPREGRRLHSGAAGRRRR